MASWQLVHIYVPARYKKPGFNQTIEDTVLPRLYGRTSVDPLLDEGWLSEVARHKDGYRRFQIHLIDRRNYTPIPVTFLLERDGELLR